MTLNDTHKKPVRILVVTLFTIAISITLLSLLGTVAHAAGLVDETVNASNLYSKYPLKNYQLDFYVDSSWDWLPWNWGDGIGKSVQYGLYCITNFLWTIGLYLSNATGYVVQEAYKLDFVNDMADSIGRSMQTLAGITQNGFSSKGFYAGFLLLLILMIGIYVTYTGVIKRETSKALHATVSFLAVFILSASFIAYAPDYIKKINDFSADISTASLELGTKIMLPNSDSRGKDSVDLIRNNLHSLQVQQPWLLLQFGNSDIEKVGKKRAESLLSSSPSANDGKDREELVKAEIEEKDNDNLTIPQVVNRLGTVFCILIFNIGISIFIFLLTAMMIFSQILFIIFAMFLPISFILSMIPSNENMIKQAIVKVFNTIMTRAGITLIVTVAFSISSMLYKLSGRYPFFMIIFLQIITFAGIYMKLGDIMSMFTLNADSQNMGRRIFRRPYMFMRHRARHMERRLARAVGVSSASGAKTGTGTSEKKSVKPDSAKQQKRKNNHNSNFGSRAGSVVGTVLDTKNHVKDKATTAKETIKDMPTQAGYAAYRTKEVAKENISGFKRGVVQEKNAAQASREEKLRQHRQNIAEKRIAMQKKQEIRRPIDTPHNKVSEDRTLPVDSFVAQEKKRETKREPVPQVAPPTIDQKARREQMAQRQEKKQVQQAHSIKRQRAKKKEGKK